MAINPDCGNIPCDDPGLETWLARRLLEARIDNEVAITGAGATVDEAVAVVEGGFQSLIPFAIAHLHQRFGVELAAPGTPGESKCLADRVRQAGIATHLQISGAAAETFCEKSGMS